MPAAERQAHAYAQTVWTAASREADDIAVRMQYSGRAVAAERFSELWPKGATKVLTRRTLEEFYMSTFERQAAQQPTALSTVDGAEASRVLAAVQKRTEAPARVVLNLIHAMAHDAHLLGREVTETRARLVEAGLVGEISRLFPRRGQTGIRQAIAEQWYARSFGAIAAPKIFGTTAHPITPLEVQEVGASLAANQARVLHVAGKPIDTLNEQAWRSLSARAWADQPLTERRQWIRAQGYGPDMALSTFAMLPPYLQVQFMTERTPLAESPIQAITTGTPLEQAAAMFDAPLIEPATPAQVAARGMVFNRGATPNLAQERPAAEPAREALMALRSASSARATRETTGLVGQRRWWSDPSKLDEAVKMRLAGATVKEISERLGVSGDSLRNGLIQADVDSDLLDISQKPRHQWTRDELIQAASLRHSGFTYEQIGEALGVSKTHVRNGLLDNAQGLGLDPVTGKTVSGSNYPQGVRPPRPAPRESDRSVDREM